jgi:hypothetical protein
MGFRESWSESTRQGVKAETKCTSHKGGVTVGSA